MLAVLEEKWPVLRRHDRAVERLGVWIDLGRVPRTIDAYARGLAEYLTVCQRAGVDPLVATRATVAGFVRELASRSSPRGVNVVALDSGAGLANATLQQRLVPVRLFYDFLIEEGLRGSNPVGRGIYTPGRRVGGSRGRPLSPSATESPGMGFITDRRSTSPSTVKASPTGSRSLGGRLSIRAGAHAVRPTAPAP